MNTYMHTKPELKSFNMQIKMQRNQLAVSFKIQTNSAHYSNIVQSVIKR